MTIPTEAEMRTLADKLLDTPLTKPEARDAAFDAGMALRALADREAQRPAEMREAIARIIDPDSWSTFDSVNGLGPPVKSMLKADAILSVLPPLAADEAKIRAEAEFLLDRLSDVEQYLTEDEFCRQYFGHVTPSIERLRDLIAPAPSAKVEAQDVVDLVIAAREMWEAHGESRDDLDKALEAFAERVPYENEPDALSTTPEPASDADRVRAASAELDVVYAALEWYASKVADCRKVSSYGEPARHALDADGGKRALEALSLLDNFAARAATPAQGAKPFDRHDLLLRDAQARLRGENLDGSPRRRGVAVDGDRGAEGWRPIETAPKDGAIWIYWPAVGDPDERQCVGWWRDDVRNGGYWMNAADSERGEPTHWMPLPAAPAPSSGYISLDNGQGMGVPRTCVRMGCSSFVMPFGNEYRCARCRVSYGPVETAAPTPPSNGEG